jgi:hypothetical protein
VSHLVVGILQHQGYGIEIEGFLQSRLQHLDQRRQCVRPQQRQFPFLGLASHFVIARGRFDEALEPYLELEIFTLQLGEPLLEHISRRQRLVSHAIKGLRVL